METIASNLEQLLDYEICAAQRYRRFVSLVLMQSLNGDSPKFRGFLADTVRGCDQLFELADGNYIVMTETPQQGAMTAAKRCKQSFNEMFHDVRWRFGVATYPADGENSSQLIAAALDRAD